MGRAPTPKLKPGLYIRLSVIDAGSEWTQRRSTGRSSPSSRPRNSGAVPVSACRWSTGSPRSSAAALR